MSVLAKLVEEDFGIKRSGSRYWKAVAHDSLVVDIEKDLFYWNSRGIYGNAIDYLVQVRGWSWGQAIEYLKNVVSDEIRRVDCPKRVSELVAIYLHKNLLYDEKFDYFKKRGIREETVRKYKLGYYSRGNVDFYSIPVYHGKKLFNIQIRTERDENSKKIVFKLYKKGEPGIFNYHLISNLKEIIIVEGLVDAILANQEGYLVLATDSGLGFNKKFYELFYGKTIYLLQDNDSAGMKAARMWAKKLGFENVYVFDWSNLQDVEEGEDVISFYQKFNELGPLFDKQNYRRLVQ